MFGVDFEAIRPIEAVPKISPRPILFIQGDQDDGVPLADATALFKASGSPMTQLWIVPGAGHSKAYFADPQEYVQRIGSFFDSALRAGIAP